jgi:hypothetical protein
VSSAWTAAANALHWAEVDCQTFRTARRYRNDQVLEIGVGMVPDRWYRVRVGRPAVDTRDHAYRP